MVQLLKDELIMCMRLMGCATIADITPDHVIAKNLDYHIPAQARDHLHLVYMNQ